MLVKLPHAKLVPIKGTSFVNVLIPMITVKEDKIIGIRTTPLFFDRGTSIWSAKNYYAKFVKFEGDIPSKAKIQEWFGDDVYFVGVAGQGKVTPTIMINPSKKFIALMNKVPEIPKRIVRGKLIWRKKIAKIPAEIDTVKIIEDPNFNDFTNDGLIFVSPKHSNLIGMEVKGLAKGTIDTHEMVPDNEIWIPKDNALKFNINHVKTSDIWISELPTNRITITKGLPPILNAWFKLGVDAQEIKINNTRLTKHLWKHIKNQATMKMIAPEIASAIRKSFRTGIKKGGAVALPSSNDDINVISIPRAIARRLHIRNGDTVVFFRSPISCRAALSKVTAKVTNEDVIRVHPLVWKFIQLGDFDGDLAFVMNDQKIAKFGVRPSHIIGKFINMVNKHEKEIEIMKANTNETFKDEYDFWKLSLANAAAVGPLTIQWYINTMHKPATVQFREFLTNVQVAIEGMKHGINANQVPYMKTEKDPDPAILFISGKIKTFANNDRVGLDTMIEIATTKKFFNIPTTKKFDSWIEELNKIAHTKEMIPDPNIIYNVTTVIIANLSPEKKKILSNIAQFTNMRFVDIRKEMIDNRAKNVFEAANLKPTANNFRMIRKLLAILFARRKNWPWNIAFADFLWEDSAKYFMDQITKRYHGR